MKILTGIGSRQTPTEVCELITQASIEIAKQGWTLRSGGADGADSAFEAGWDFVPACKEIYLPWKNFNKKQGIWDIPKAAQEMAATIHPAWHACSHGARLLHARNCCQVLGLTLDQPSDIVVCWTMDGKLKGGTRTALVLAAQHNVPIINLADEKYKNASVDGIVKLVTGG